MRGSPQVDVRAPCAIFGHHKRSGMKEALYVDSVCLSTRYETTFDQSLAHLCAGSGIRSSGMVNVLLSLWERSKT